MTFAAAIPALIQAAGSIGSGYLAGRNSGQESKMQRTQRKLVDKLLGSLNGGGEYGDLFNADEDTFQKSFVQPAQSMFRNQIAPQIQQQYIASGQQNGTGLEDQLLRAGVDLDSLLNSHMMEYQQGAMNRKQNAISGILGSGSGGTQDMGSGQAFGSATSGYLSSDGFKDAVSGIFKNNTATPQAQGANPYAAPPRKGFEPEWKGYGLGDKRWGQ